MDEVVRYGHGEVAQPLAAAIGAVPDDDLADGLDGLEIDLPPILADVVGVHHRAVVVVPVAIAVHGQERPGDAVCAGLARRLSRFVVTRAAACTPHRPRERKLAMGSNHACVLQPGGEVRCWGQNSVGNLGLGHTDPIGDREGEIERRRAARRAGVAGRGVAVVAGLARAGVEDAVAAGRWHAIAVAAGRRDAVVAGLAGAGVEDAVAAGGERAILVADRGLADGVAFLAGLFRVFSRIIASTRFSAAAALAFSMASTCPLDHLRP